MSTATPRPITVRFPTEDLDRLLQISQLTGLSTSQLLREGATLVGEKYLADFQNPEEIIAAAAERAAERMRAILGSPKAGMAYEATHEAISYAIASLSRLLASGALDSDHEEDLTVELREAVRARRNLDPTHIDEVEAVRRKYETRSRELRSASELREAVNGR
jgi:hypothetical protein